jgi:hypothetical protein
LNALTPLPGVNVLDPTRANGYASAWFPG